MQATAEKGGRADFSAARAGDDVDGTPRLSPVEQIAELFARARNSELLYLDAMFLQRVANLTRG